MKKCLRKIKRYLKILIGMEVYAKPQVKCPISRLGCDYCYWDINPELLNSNSIIYSLGVGEEISFDLDLIARFGTNVYAFDPTPRSIEWVNRQNTPSEFIMHEYGVAGIDGQITLYSPGNPEYVSLSIVDKDSTEDSINIEVFRVPTIMKNLGHEKIDLMKINIEGGEYDIIDDIIESEIEIKQLLVEFHHRFKGISIGKTRQALSRLKQKGYKIFAISDYGNQYSFINIDE